MEEEVVREAADDPIEDAVLPVAAETMSRFQNHRSTRMVKYHCSNLPDYWKCIPMVTDFCGVVKATIRENAPTHLCLAR